MRQVGDVEIPQSAFIAALRWTAARDDRKLHEFTARLPAFCRVR